MSAPTRTPPPIPLPPDQQTVRDLAYFSRHMIRSKDIDPLYPVLRELYNLMALNDEQQFWFTTLYLAYYDVTSALRAYRLCPNPGWLPQVAATFRCATERRGMRGGNVIRHIHSYLEKIGTIPQRTWITDGWSPHDVQANYLLFWDRAQTIWQNGRWAAFKWADLLKNVHGLPLAAPDMRMQFCSGPRAGLCSLYGLPDNAPIKTLNECGDDLRGRLRAYNVTLSDGSDLDYETLETLLCNWHSLTHGRYYVGHDIDELQHVIDHAYLSKDDRALLYDARLLALPAAYLGEYLMEWKGIDRARMRVYHDTKFVLVRRQRSGGAG